MQPIFKQINPTRRMPHTSPKLPAVHQLLSLRRTYTKRTYTTPGTFAQTWHRMLLRLQLNSSMTQRDNLNLNSSFWTSEPRLPKAASTKSISPNSSLMAKSLQEHHTGTTILIHMTSGRLICPLMTSQRKIKTQARCLSSISTSQTIRSLQRHWLSFLPLSETNCAKKRTKSYRYRSMKFRRCRLS